MPSCAAGNAASFNPVLPGRTPESKLRAFVRGLLQQIYGEDRPAWPVRLMTHELAQPTPAFDGVVEQIMRPKHDAISALVADVIGRPLDDRQTRLCTQSIMGQIITLCARPRSSEEVVAGSEVHARNSG